MGGGLSCTIRLVGLEMLYFSVKELIDPDLFSKIRSAFSVDTEGRHKVFISPHTPTKPNPATKSPVQIHCQISPVNNKYATYLNQL